MFWSCDKHDQGIYPGLVSIFYLSNWEKMLTLWW